ncbi:MAG TPA: metal-dependent hydrolase [Nitrospiria bacterium]|nr:metal-dependent hydrolase [Nitrospiria bacterium]
MDPVTHTLIGIGMANAFFRRKIGPEAVPILAIASNLPDVDVLAHLSGDPTAILMRRTFGHSLILLPFWAMLFTLTARYFYKDLRVRVLFGLAALGMATHLFFDLINSFGVVLFWPFSDWRPELAIVFIIDLFLTGFLAAPLLLCLIRRVRPHLVWLSQVSMACVAAYLLLCGVNRILAQRALAAEVDGLGAMPSFSYVFPEPLGPHRWRGVTREGGIYHIYLIHTFSGRVEPKGAVQTQVGDPSVERARGTALARRIEWFFKAPVWTVRRDPPGSQTPANRPIEASVYDLRFKSLVIDRGSPFEYRFRISSEGRVVGLGWRGGREVLTFPD